MRECEIKTFYSAKIIMIFISIYGGIALVALALNVFIYYFAGEHVSMGMITAMSTGGFMGGFYALQRSPPTRISISNHSYFYVARNVEAVIDSLSVEFAQERRYYGFAWGYKREDVDGTQCFFLPLGTPRYPNGILGPFIHNKISQLRKYGGITSIVEVRKDGDGVLIFGPLVTVKKIYDEIC